MDTFRVYESEDAFYDSATGQRLAHWERAPSSSVRELVIDAPGYDPEVYAFDYSCKHLSLKKQGLL